MLNLKNYWNRLAADKLRRAADVLDPPAPSAPVRVHPADIDALERLAELGPISSVVKTFDQQGMVYSGLSGDFVMDSARSQKLRARGLITGPGGITKLGRRALQLGRGIDEMPADAGLPGKARPRRRHNAEAPA